MICLADRKLKRTLGGLQAPVSFSAQELHRNDRSEEFGP
jgi:hypothetical protein